MSIPFHYKSTVFISIYLVFGRKNHLKPIFFYALLSGIIYFFPIGTNKIGMQPM